MKRSHKILANLAIALIYGFAFLFAIWLFRPYRPLEVHDDQMKVLNEEKTVCIGDTLQYEMNYIARTNITPTLDKTLVDGLIFHLTETNAYTKGGKKEIGVPQKVIGTVVIPETAPEGDFYLQIDATYEVNPVREVMVSFRTENFDIIKCE